MFLAALYLCVWIQGLTADVDGVAVAVGSLRLLGSVTGRDLPAEVLAADAGWRAQGMTAMWVAVARRPAGAIVASDAPRREAADAVATLQRRKLHCAMLTGQCQGPLSPLDLEFRQ